MLPGSLFGLKFDSLRSRLLLLVILVILPPVGLTIHSAIRERQHSIEVAESDLIRLTSLAAASEAKLLEGVRQFLTGLSDMPDLSRDSATCSTLLQSMLKKNPGYNNLGVLELSGNLRCSAIAIDNTVNLRDRSNVQKTLATGKFATGDYVFGRAVRKHVVNASYPIVDANNRMTAVLFASLDLEALDKFAAEIDLPPNAIVITVDSNGTIIGRRPFSENWIGTRVSKKLLDPMVKVRFGTAEITDADQITRLHAFAPVGNADVSNFTISIGIPTAEIVASANYQQTTQLLVLFATATMALLGAWFIANVTILDRVQALVRATRRIGAGDLSTRSEIKYGHGEIDELALAFDRMAYVIQRNTAEQEHARINLLAEKELAKVTLKSIGDGVIVLDREGNITSVNTVAELLTGWTSQEAYGRPLDKVFNTTNGDLGQTNHGSLNANSKASQYLTLDYSNQSKHDYRLVGRDGSSYVIETSMTPIHDSQQAVSAYVMIFRDVSEQRKLAQQLKQQICHDPLTGLLNQSEFERRLGHIFNYSGAHARHHALLYIDLDHFKIINTRYGRKAGDTLLLQVKDLLQSIVGEGDILARVSGDKFAALLENCTPITAQRIANVICKTVDEHRFIWRDEVISLSVSIGLFNFNNQQISLDELLKKTDEICKLAREYGGNKIHQHIAPLKTLTPPDQTEFERTL
jgi:diguanylate cyclase (GGDEF)-like protein/PAS domain S-box-containing protein